MQDFKKFTTPPPLLQKDIFEFYVGIPPPPPQCLYMPVQVKSKESKVRPSWRAKPTIFHCKEGGWPQMTPVLLACGVPMPRRPPLPTPQPRATTLPDCICKCM